jgi:hypothetical protein
MKSLIFILFLIAVPIRAEDVELETEAVDFSAEDPEMIPEDIKLPLDKDSKPCKDISWDDLKIKAVRVDGNIEFHAFDKETAVDKYTPYVDGPENKCLKTKEFEKEQMFFVEFCHGYAGTKVIVERHTLLAFKWDGKKIRRLRSFNLKFIEQDGENLKVKYENTFKIKRRDGRVTVTLKNRTTKEKSEFAF